MIEIEAAKILKEDSCWECSHGTIYGATQCGNTQCNVARATNLAVTALEQLAAYKQGGLCLVPADTYEKQCKELDELKEKNTAKKARNICWCTKCDSYNQAWAGHMKVAPYDTVYCWHCGQAHRLEA